MRALGLPVLLALGLSACGDGTDSRVSLDLTDLWQAVGQTASTISVWAYDQNGNYLSSDFLTDFASSVYLVVTPGPSCRFEVEADLTDRTTTTPSYWGEKVVDLHVGDDIELVVPVFPAGGVTGVVTVTDGTAIPEGTPVVATATAPRTDAPASREFLIAGGAYSGTLPDGDYTLTVSYGTAAPYSGQTSVTVVREQITPAGEIVVGP